MLACVASEETLCILLSIACLHMYSMYTLYMQYIYSTYLCICMYNKVYVCTIYATRQAVNYSIHIKTTGHNETHYY